MTDEACLEISDVSYAYGAKAALKEVTFTVRRGRFTALLGPNGAGKSTLVALVSTLIVPRQGEMTVLGRPLGRDSRPALAAMGIVFQQQTLDLDLTVRQNMLYFAKLHGLSGKAAGAGIVTDTIFFKKSLSLLVFSFGTSDRNNIDIGDQIRERMWPSLTITLKDRRDLARLVMEGGQGFVPTHEMEDVAGRMREAAAAGVRAYTSLVGMPDDAISCETTFEKLHNAAFIGPLDGPALNALLAIGRQLGIYGGEPLRGFDASCDARIFAREFPEAEIITFGPGQLAQAHANDEHVDIEAILTAVEALVRLALTYGR